MRRKNVKKEKFSSKMLKLLSVDGSWRFVALRGVDIE